MRVEDQFLYPLFFDFSPVTSIDNHASFVTFNGEVGGRANGDLISSSYGSPDTGNRLNPCVIMNRGVVAGYNFSIFVYDSYGYKIASISGHEALR